MSNYNNILAHLGPSTWWRFFKWETIKKNGICMSRQLLKSVHVELPSKEIRKGRQYQTFLLNCVTRIYFVLWIVRFSSSTDLGTGISIWYFFFMETSLIRWLIEFKHQRRYLSSFNPKWRRTSHDETDRRLPRKELCVQTQTRVLHNIRISIYVWVT